MQQQGAGFGQQLSSKKQQEFYSWLRRIPFGLLQEFHKEYLHRENTESIRREEVSEQSTLVSEEEKQPPLSARESIILRKSIFLLVGMILGIEIFFDACYLTIKFVPMILSIPQFFQTILTPWYPMLFFVITLLKLIFICISTLRWLTTRYVIGNGEIRFRYGIIFTNEKIYLCTYAQEVTCTQGFIGRIFNFGTITVYNPVQKETICLDSIQNPRRYMEMIKNSLSNTPNAVPLPL